MADHITAGGNFSPAVLIFINTSRHRQTSMGKTDNHLQLIPGLHLHWSLGFHGLFYIKDSKPTIGKSLKAYVYFLN